MYRRQTEKTQRQKIMRVASKLTLEGGLHGKFLPYQSLVHANFKERTKYSPFSEIRIKTILVIRTYFETRPTYTINIPFGIKT